MANNVIVTGARAAAGAIPKSPTLLVIQKGSPTVSSGGCAFDGTDSVVLPPSFLNATTGWVAAGLKPGWAGNNSGTAHSYPVLFDGGNNNSVYYHDTSWRINSGAQELIFSSGHTANDAMVISATWDASALKITKGTSTFGTATRSTVQPMFQHVIGNNFGGSLPLTGSVYWIAGGTTLLSQSSAGTLASFGTTNPSSYPADTAFYWTADDFVVRNPTVTSGGDGLITAALGPVTAGGPTTVAGGGAGAGGAGATGIIGMFTAWTGAGVASPFVIGVTAQATATAQPGSFQSTNITIIGTQALSTATGQAGTFPLEQPAASLVLEIDFVGNPAAPFYDQISQSPGVVSYWRLDDAGQLTDTLGANTGAITGTPTLITGALAYDTDQALRFNGTSQYGQVPSSATLAQTGSYSLSGWLRFPTLPSAAKTIVTKGNYRLEINSSNQLVWSVTNDQSGVLTNTSVTSHNSLEANTWYRVACVHDFGVELRLYLNGVLDNSVAHLVGTELHTTPVTFSGLPFGTAPAFRAVSTAGNPAGFNNTNFVITVPTVVTGDLMLAQIVDNNSTGFGMGGGPVTAPAGWNLLGTQGTAAVNSGVFMAVYWRIATASEPASYTWTTTVATNWGGAISTYSGVNTTDPFAKPFYGYSDTSNTTTHTTGPHLHTEQNCLAVAMVADWANPGGIVSSWSSSASERWDGGGASVPTGCVAAATVVPTAGVSTEIIATGLNRQFKRALVTLRGTGIGSFTAADLDEWTFWNVALTDEQVANEYEARSSGVGTWTDVSADAKGMSLGYGRQYELNRMEGGSANVVLKNQLRKYDPANTSSVYAPNVKPNRRIRARAYYRGVYYPLWEGLIERWPSNWGISPNYDEVSLTSVDGYKALNRAGIVPTQTAGLSGAQIDLLLTRALWSIDARAIDAGAFIMAADTTTATTTALSVIQDVTDSELGLFLVNHAAAGSPATFHDRSHRWTTTRSVVSQATFTDQPTGGIRYLKDGLVPSDDDDNMVNEWIVTSANGTTATAVDSISRQQNFPLTSERSTRLDNTLDADTQAKALLQQTARPGLRFDALTVRLMRQSTAITWQTCLGLAISDRVTVIRNPVPGAGGSTISKDCFVEGISWDITPSYWDLTLRLSPVSTMGYYDVILLDDPVSYWRLDTVT